MQERDLQAMGFVAVLAGPTASGKSALGAAIAAKHGWAVISADSMQVYRGMEIGTGVPTEAEQLGVPHHLLSIVDPPDEFTAARFVDAAHAAARIEWEANGRRSLVVGGTGMWIEALRWGLFDGPSRDETVRARLRERLAAEGEAALHAELARVDPATAAKLAVRDMVRVMRALEVWELSGRTMSDWHAEDEARRARITPIPLVVLDWSVPDLDARIRRRILSMLESGWLEEARRLRDTYALEDNPTPGRIPVPAHASARLALGYATLFRVLDGKLPLREAIEAINMETRQYAKRQRSWFRGRKDAIWVPAEISAVEKALGSPST